MWIMSPVGFVSIVRKDCPAGHLLVRSRRRECLEALFPDAVIVEGAGTDYQFRATIPQLDVVSAVSAMLIDIDYGNHKGATKDRALHDAYSGVWSVMSRLQPRKPFSFGRGMDGGLFAGPDGAGVINSYSCPDCGHKWDDEWDCEVDDSCPMCSTLCSPVSSVFSDA